MTMDKLQMVTNRFEDNFNNIDEKFIAMKDELLTEMKESQDTLKKIMGDQTKRDCKLMEERLKKM